MSSDPTTSLSVKLAPLMPLLKILPFIIMALLAFQNRNSVTKRAAKMVSMESFAQYNMSMILHSIQFQHDGSQNMVISDKSSYIKSKVTAKLGDPTTDPWGTAYDIYIEDGRIWLYSAGPDRIWDTGDDIEESVKVFSW